MIITAIDPGNIQSAYVTWDGKKIISKDILPNADLIYCIPSHSTKLCIEMIASYGMPVGATVFETCVWIGRFIELWQVISLRPIHELIYRKDVKMHHCNSTRAKDSNIHQALVDRFGDKGTKKNPGLTYGLSKDMWAAFAIATYAYDKYLVNKV
jgi:hypothetical protein